MNIIETFYSPLALNLNHNRKERIWIGAFQYNILDKIEGIRWTDKPVKALGIRLGNDRHQCKMIIPIKYFNNIGKHFLSLT